LRIALLLALLLPAALPGPARGHEARDPQDEILRSVGIDERPGDAVPRDAVFRDETGREARLGDYLGDGPVILTLNYYTCPMLCPLTLRNLLEAARRTTGLDLGRDFRIVTVSIDPADGVDTARARAREIHSEMRGIADPASRWPFLVGDDNAVRRLTGAVGFRYRKVGKEFAHPDAVVVLTPEGSISRYGVEHDPNDLRFALLEAAGGRIGKSQALNRILLYCFHYDPVGRKYALYARNVMTAAGVFTLVFLGLLYYLLWWRKGAGVTSGSGGRNG
jgi:protein SCO1/2